MTHERIYVWFADNGSIRKWDRCPFPEGVEYVRADLLAAAQAEARELRTQMEQVRQIADGMREARGAGYWRSKLAEALAAGGDQ